jgi:sorbitol/mannitol transport system substrate-binding protein
MYWKNALCAATALTLVSASSAFAQSITIATVNNGDMIRMQGYTDEFTAKTGIEVEWVTLEENVLRQRVTTDISTKGGQFDIMTIGMYETPIWGANGWLVPLDDLSAEYDVDDILPAMRGGLSHDGTLYAAPFYGESSMVMYRTDLMESRALEMPDAPSWDFIRKAAIAMTDRDKDINGICLRGKAGWGEGGAFITVTGNSFGARWFDENWKAQFDQPEWSNALNFFVDLMAEAGPPGYSTNGFNENLSLFQQGKCGMWIDATVAASFVTNPNDSTVADKVGFALAPDTGLGKRANWLWAWALAIPAGTKQQDAAKKFIEWATSKEYIELVAAKRRLGQCASGRPDLALREPGVPEGAVREDDARLHQRGRSDEPDGRSRFPMSASSSWPFRSLRVSQPRSARSSRRHMPVSSPLKKRLQRRRP